MAKRLGRRQFLQGAAAGAAAIAAPAPGLAQPAPTESAQAPARHRHPPAPRSAPPEQAYLFLNEAEAAMVAAAIDVFLPADDVGPGGVESGVVVYIDRQLAGAWGAGDRLYTAGPWVAGTPEQGYQLPLVPAQFYRAALAELDQLCRQSFGGGFADLPVSRRDEVLAGLHGGQLKLATLPGKTFASLLLENAVEGYFADPAYGGNRGMAAWRMIGFPGARGSYAEEIETYRGKPFPGEPVSLADLQ